MDMVGKYLNPQNDVAFRKIFGTEKNQDILIHFLNDILGYEGPREIKEVTFLSPIQDAEIASKKQSIIDVLCKDQTGAQFIIEMQVSKTKGFEKRALYYASKAYSRQLNKGQEEDGQYANLKEIIFIAISNYIIFPEKEDYKSDHVILDKDNYDHNLKDFYFTFIELPKFKKTLEELTSITEKWCYFFKYAQTTTKEQLERLIDGDEVIKRAYDALEKHNWTEEELIAYEQEVKRVMDNRAAEAALIDDAKAERNMEIAQNLLDAGLQSDLIAKTTGLSEEEIKKLQKK